MITCCKCERKFKTGRAAVAHGNKYHPQEPIPEYKFYPNGRTPSKRIPDHTIPSVMNSPYMTEGTATLESYRRANA